MQSFVLLCVNLFHVAVVVVVVVVAVVVVNILLRRNQIIFVLFGSVEINGPISNINAKCF